MDEHLKQYVREGLGKTLNHHKPGVAPSMVLFGSRRSGTTIVAQAIGTDKDVKVVDQPLSPFTASLTQLRRLPLFRSGYAMFPDERETQRIVEYFRDIETGRLHVREDWRVWSRQFHHTTSRILYKCTAGHAISQLVQEATQALPMALFRHPIAQSVSCHRLGWPTRINCYLENRRYTETFLDRTLLATARAVQEGGSMLEQYVLDWILENIPLYRRAVDDERIPYVTYEWMVADTAQALSLVCKQFQLTLTNKMVSVFDRPSRSSRRGTGSAVERHLRAGERMAMLSGWQQEVEPRVKERIDGLLEEFGINLYSGHEVEPRKWSS